MYGLRTGNHESLFFKSVLEILASLEFRDKLGYHTEWRLLNTSTHFGIPQNRSRTYLVGAWLSLLSEPRFDWPEPVPMVNLSTFLGINTAKGLATF